MSGVEAILGVVSAGAGLLSLSIQLFESAQKLKGLADNIRNAPGTLGDLEFDLQTMGLALQQLEKHRQQDSHDATLLARCLERCAVCTSRIQKAVDKMTAYSAKSSKLGKMYVAFKEKDLDKLLKDLEGAKSSLHLSLNMYWAQENERRHRALLDLSKNSGGLALSSVNAHTVITTQNERAGEKHISHSHRDSILVKASRRPVFQMTAKLPSWLYSKVWDIAVLDAMGAWNLSIRPYNIRPMDSEIFHSCLSGNLNKVQKLIADGKASLSDTETHGMNLIHMAAISGRLELCEWLLDRSPWLYGSDHLDAALGMWNFSTCAWSQEPNLLEVYQLFFQRHGLFLDLSPILSGEEDRSMAWRFCQDPPCVRYMISQMICDLDSYTLTERMDLACQEAPNHRLDPAAFLAKLGLSDTDPRLSGLKSRDGITVLHLVARHGFLSTAAADKSLAWRQLGLNVIKLGAEPVVIGSAFKRWNAVGMQVTPLLALLLTSLWEPNAITFAPYCVRRWAQFLQSAGIDLVTYGENERRAWETLKVREWQHPRVSLTWSTAPFNTSRQQWCYPLELLIDEQASRWDVMIRTCSTITIHDRFETPGSFEPNTLQTILWNPDTREEAEGVWIPRQHHLPPGTPFQMYASSGLSRQEIFEALINCSQDDTRFVLHTVLRSEKRALPCKRSRSQPPRHCPEQFESPFALESNTHKWLPSFHWCSAASTFKLVGSCKPPYQIYDRQREPRHCFQSEQSATHPVFDDGANDGSLWSQRSFLGEIAICQQGQLEPRRRFEARSPLTQHTGTPDCPQGCVRVRLDRIRVPDDLRRFHPQQEDLW